MAKCWKCGKEVSGYYTGLLGTVCPECQTLDVLKRMEEKRQEEAEKQEEEAERRREERRKKMEREARWEELAKRQIKMRKEWCVKHNVPVFELPGDKFASEEYVLPPSAISTPEWWKKAMDPKSPGVAGVLALLLGEWGIPFLYIGKNWTALGAVMMFAIFATLLAGALNTDAGEIGGICIVIYMLFTNLLMAVWFFSMDDDDFLKRFRYDLWEDKQIANQYGHEIHPSTGNYTDIPVNKPSWDEAFSAKQKDSTQEEQKASSTPSDDDASKPKVPLRIVKYET